VTGPKLREIKIENVQQSKHYFTAIIMGRFVTKCEYNETIKFYNSA